MEKVDRVITYLAYARRNMKQMMDYKNLKHVHLLFRGFTPDKGHYYDFKKYGYKNYVTDATRYLKTVFINYNNRNLIQDKYGCYLFLKEFTDKVVPVYALIDRGELYFVDKYPTLDELLANQTKLVLKPRVGRGGDGVMVVTVQGGKVYLNARECFDFRAAIKRLKNYIIVPYVEPHSYSARIFPGSLNTIRLLTCVLDGKIELLRAGHRFGADYSSNVDNVSHGGVSALVNLESGVLEDVIWIDQKNHKKLKADLHPITNERILGVEIPNWQSVRDDVMRTHGLIRFVKYIGWDIAITPTGYRIIEANSASDLDAPQLHFPLLLDDQNKKFFSRL